MVWGPVSEAAAQTTLSISGPADANEGDSGTRDLTYTVSLSQRLSNDDVHWEICFSGTATINTLPNWGTSGADYRTALRGSVRGSTCEKGSLGSNYSSLTNTSISIQVRGDTDVESNETVIATLTIRGTPPAGVTLGTSTHTHTILNDDTVALPEVTIAAGSPSVTEGADASFTVTASPAPASALTVKLTVSESGNFASSGETGTSKTVSVSTSGSATHSVSTVDDDTDENNGSVTVTVNAGTGYTVGSPNSATVTVNDNDTAGVTVSQSARTVAENGGTATYTVGLDTRPAGQVTITVTAGGAAFVDGPGGNTKPKAKDTLTFTTSNWSTAQTVTITGQNDNIVNTGGERTRTITHTIEAGDGDGQKYRPAALTTFSIPSVTVTVTDDDAPSTPELTITGGSAVTEGGDASFVISSNPAPGSSITVAYTVSQSGAFVASGQLGDKTRSVSAASTTVAISTEDDNLDEANGSVTVTLNNGNGYTVGSANAATVTVNDNDDSTDPGGGGNPGGGNPGGGDPGGGSDPTQITLAVYPNPIYEGRRATIHAELAHTVPSVVTLPLVFTTNDAETGDYVALATIVIDANEPFGTDWILTTKDDDMEDETFTVTFGALPAGFSRGTPASVDVIISEDENVTSIESPEGELPDAFALGQNYPNPFNPSTAIEYEIPTPQHVRLEVFDATGRSVGVLVDGILPAGTHSVRFDADNLPSGLYVYRLQANGETLTRKMTLLR